MKNKNKIVKLKNKISNNKLLIFSGTIILLFVILIIRIGWIQFVDGSNLKELAYSQQTINQIISPERGNIYDSTGKALAISERVDTITINPKKIKGKNDESTKEIKEKVAKAFSEIFGLEYNTVLEKVNSESSVETIVKKVEQDKVTKLQSWMKENNISVGINIDEDTKRYYPYSTLASHVLGFCGTDNDGRTGIEYKWNSVLSGTAGKIVSSKDSAQSEIPNSEQTYIAAEAGSDLTLTIDVNIQSIVEKYLKQAVEDNSCSNGGNVIVMQPSTGDILSMASYPDYDLNTPSTPNSYIATNWDSLSSDEKNNSLFKMWSNKSVSETYEPGSVFKVLNAAIALEENITETDISKNFLCIGYEQVADRTIKCWSSIPHGYQTLRQSLENSCNPAFMQLGTKLGATTMYKYYKAFGLFDKTGVALASESNSSFWQLKDVKSPQLATMSFGQRFEITPLQMVTAISCISNDGILMQPRIVKEITNPDTGSVTTVEPTQIRQVISKETAKQVKSMMESVVTDGTGYRASIEGYSIGGKTGTSEPNPGKSDSVYVASYLAISPVENTEVVLLLTLYGPQGASHQGGTVAGPVVGQMLSEILPYLGIVSDAEKDYSSDETKVTLPDITNKTVTEAKKILTSAGITSKITTNGDANSLLVKDQVPKAGTILNKDAIVMLYSEENNIRTSVTVPDLKGMSGSQATNVLKAKNLNIEIEGNEGTVISQNYSKDASVEEGTIIKVTLKDTSTIAH